MKASLRLLRLNWSDRQSHGAQRRKQNDAVNVHFHPPCTRLFIVARKFKCTREDMVPKNRMALDRFKDFW